MEAQCSTTVPDDDSRREELNKILKERIEQYKQDQHAIIKKCDKKLGRILEQAQEKGASNWLTCLPLQNLGFTMNKSEFRDSIRLRYGLQLDRLPSQCQCGHAYSVNHALNCHLGGFVIIRHNEVRDFLAARINSVCKDVETEPPPQELNGEMFSRSTTLTGENARPDIRARGFYRPGQHTFMDVRIVNPNSESYCDISTKKVCERAEKQKKTAYEDRIINIEHGSFIPLIFTVTGGMGPQAQTFFKLLCHKTAYKLKQNYSDVCSFMRCKLSFLLKRLSLLCIRGSRNVQTKSVVDFDNDFEFNCFASKLKK